jgi:hypothetical protein
MRNPTRSPLPFSAALLLAAAIGASPARAAEIFPTETAPGKTFTLTVTGKTFLCQPIFSGHEAVFENGALHLSVVGESNPAALCTAVEHPYKVSFQVPAAKAGLYAVDVAVVPPCAKGPAMCDIAIKPEPAGVLTVKESTIPVQTVTITPAMAKAGLAFTLTLSGTTTLCDAQFSNHKVTVENGTVHLSVMAANNPAALCIAGNVPSPYKTEFKVPALPAGTYKVLAYLNPPCMYAVPVCLIATLPQNAGILEITQAVDPVPAVTISPRDTESGRAFSVTVSGTTMLCQPVFSMHSATASNGTLYLSVKAENNPLAKCTTGPHAYQTAFKVPALTAGTYKVLVSLLPACSFDKPPCLTGTPAANAGILTVRDRPIWTEPARVVSGSAFLLELHGTGYTCNDAVTDKQVDVKDGAIRLRYTLSLTKKICPDTIVVHHETFSVPALKNGAYPVFLAPNLHCPTGHFLCAESLATLAVDTVSVVSIVGLKPGQSPLRGKPAGNGGLRIDLREGTVKGAWKGSDADLSGRKTLPVR